MEDKDKIVQLLEDIKNGNDTTIQLLLRDVKEFNEFLEKHPKIVFDIIKNNSDLYDLFRDRNIKEMINHLNSDDGEKLLIKFIESYLESEHGKKKIILIVKEHDKNKELKRLIWVLGTFGSILTTIFTGIVIAVVTK